MARLFIKMIVWEDKIETLFLDQIQRDTLLVSSVCKIQKVRGSCYTYPFGGLIFKNFSFNIHLDPH